MTRICFVCLGNICRSPTAEGIVQDLVERAGLQDQVALDSAGTGAWHVGNPPDARSRARAERRGYRIEGAARQFSAEDFDRFDLVLAMDADNLSELRELARTPEERDAIRLFRDFGPETCHGKDVPDPYYGGDAGFDRVLDICERAGRGLVAHLREQSPA